VAVPLTLDGEAVAAGLALGATAACLERPFADIRPRGGR
jgi:hypothetical protein